MHRLGGPWVDAGPLAGSIGFWYSWSHDLAGGWVSAQWYTDLVPWVLAVGPRGSSAGVSLLVGGATS